MIKSMTGFSKAETFENNIKAIVEIKSVNGRFLEVSSRLPKTLSQREFEIKDIIKSILSRGSVSLNITLEYDGVTKPFVLNEQAATNAYNALKELNKKLKIKEPVKFEHLLTFQSFFNQGTEETDSALEWKVTKKALITALRNLDGMRLKEGQQMDKDFQNRLKIITNAVEKIEGLSAKRVPDEREKLRQKIAQLFDSDEIDENRIQMEIVMIANRLDVSEECVRLRSHIKFFFEALKGKEPVGQKLNFLLQEMNREINTVGSKSDSAEISHFVVSVKEELERIREQVQNIE